MLEREISQAVTRLGLAGRRVLVAVSGGLDSTALLHLLHAQARRHRLELSVGHVNHGLRGEASDADEAAVRALADALGLPVRSLRADPRPRREGGPSRSRPTLQEAAREARYEALRELAAELGAERIATAHTADDQAETVLLRLLRGSGPDGLARHPRALARWRDRAARCSQVSRRELEALCRGARPRLARGRLEREARLRAQPAPAALAPGPRERIQSATAQGPRRTGRSTTTGRGMDRGAGRARGRLALQRGRRRGS